MATLKIAFDICYAAEVKQVTVLTLLDISTAFSTIDYSKLLQCLSYTYSITNTALQSDSLSLLDFLLLSIFKVNNQLNRCCNNLCRKVL